MSLKLPATVVPPLTPFTADLKVDYDALKAMVDYVVDECDATMVIAAGVEAQEYQFLSFEERKELIAKTIEFTAGRRPVVTGISHPSYRTAIELGHFAKEKGSAAVQLLAPLRPMGGPAPAADIVRYFELVTAEVDLPMMLYLNAGPGADLAAGTVVELAKLDRIEYVKESSRDLARVSRLIAEIDHAGHARYFTTMQMLLPTLMLKGTGVTLPPPATKLATAIISAVEGKDFEEAARLQLQFATFPARWMPHGLASVMKAVLNHLGVPAGDPYPPYKPITGADLESLLNYVDGTDLVAKES